MKIVCSWCKRDGLGVVLGEREPLDDPSETHGICAWHAVKVVEELPSSAFPGIRTLIVVRQSEIELFDHLTRSLAGLSDIAVIVDRRHGERRRTVRDVTRERRQVNRRIRTTGFSSLGYVVVRFGPEHGTGAHPIAPVRPTPHRLA